MREFKGRVAVVTGAASGIGRGLAERFAAEGMRVVLADVERTALDQTASELAASGADVLAVRTDVSKLADVEALAQQTIERFGAVHVVCNNAGVGGGGGMFSWDTPYESWEWTLGVNLWGVVHGVRAFVPLMLERGDEGHIVNTASVAGLVAGAGGPAYTASKFGVVGYSESLYHELQFVSGGKIGVSVLCPAAVNTRILESGRNYPAGPMPEPPAGTPERAMFDAMKEHFATQGMAPSEVARQVLDAIMSGRFYVLTHPEHNDRLRKRAEAILAGGPPPLITPE
ncbi:MAG TPA: SDR family NAD(P)-dependent oxidoreductase [Dehalococcoidia bacterium]|nr:SDR family NAD(P)-dependent oxidoreductase [Dehalococcoidia bacterium]